MSLKSLFLWFYCLPAEEAAKIMLAAAAFFLALKDIFSHKRWWKPAVALALLVWVAIVVYATVTGRGGGHTGQPNLIPFHSYREVNNGGSWELLLSNYMNILLFFPAGLLHAALLPRKWPWWCRILVTTLAFFVLSSCLEYCQYIYQLGQVEIDDVLHNALGALLGSFFGIVQLPTNSKERGN